MAIVLDDIERLNRLITDISDASRLDAELMRGEVKPVDLDALLADMVQPLRHHRRRQKAGVEVEFAARRQPALRRARP